MLTDLIEGQSNMAVAVDLSQARVVDHAPACFSRPDAGRPVAAGS